MGATVGAMVDHSTLYEPHAATWAAVYEELDTVYAPTDVGRPAGAQVAPPLPVVEPAEEPAEAPVLEAAEEDATATAALEEPAGCPGREYHVVQGWKALGKVRAEGVAPVAQERTLLTA